MPGADLPRPAARRRTEVRRLPELAVTQQAEIDRVLDAGLVADVGFMAEGWR